MLSREDMLDGLAFLVQEFDGSHHEFALRISILSVGERRSD
jgi:hypothetical protein